jgi:hypothetical protein
MSVMLRRMARAVPPALVPKPALTRALRPSFSPYSTMTVTEAEAPWSSDRWVNAIEHISEADVLSCQHKWATAIKDISRIYLAKGDYIHAAGEAAAELYGYGHSNVLFKPTKATANPFRPTAEEAMSYFVGGSVVSLAATLARMQALRSTVEKAGATACSPTIRSTSTDPLPSR